MDQEQLIEKVTRELVRRLGLTEKSSGGKPWLVAGNGDTLPPELLGMDVEFLSSQEERSPDFGKYMGVIVPALSENQLVLASFGMKYGLESSLIAGGLLAGVPVYILEGGITWRCAANPESSLGRHYAECEKKLASFGAVFLTAGEMAGKIPAVPSAAPSSCTACGMADLTGRKVISERDVKSACMGGCAEIVVDGKTIITPLAADYLRLNAVDVVRSREEKS